MAILTCRRCLHWSTELLALLPVCIFLIGLPAVRADRADAEGLREHAASGLAGDTVGCARDTEPVMLVDPPCPTEVSAEQVCPFEQVRLTPGTWDAENFLWYMSISFTTNNHTMPGGKSVPVVRMAHTREPLFEGASDVGCVLYFTGATTSYQYASSGGPYFSPATKYYDSPQIHHVPIGPLMPSTTYFYQVGRLPRDAQPGLYRDTIFSFRTPPAPGSTTGGPMTVIMIGDIGQTMYSNQTAYTVKQQQAADPSVAAAVIIGDMAYADGDGNRWDTWGRLMEQTFADLPLAVLPGNHEIEMDAETYMPFSAYRARFRMPSQTPESIGPILGGDLLYEGGSSFYSFSMGLVHFVMLNNYNTHNALLNMDTDPQRLFLEADLASVDRATTPFVIVCMHNPLYNSNVGHHREVYTLMMKKWAEPLFIKYGVDAVFAGHVHAYERNGGVEFGKLSHRGPVYITIGNGGNHEGLYDEWLPKPDYSQFRDGRYFGHGQLTVYNATHIKWSWTPNPEQGPNLPSDEAWIRPFSLRTDSFEQREGAGQGGDSRSQTQSQARVGTLGEWSVVRAAGVPAIGVMVVGAGVVAVILQRLRRPRRDDFQTPLLA
jgi:hypothetical protein